MSLASRPLRRLRLLAWPLVTAIRRRRWHRLVRRGRPVGFTFRGLKLVLNPEPAALHHIANSTSKLHSLVECIPPDARVVFDVGANCGLFSAFAAQRLPDAELHIFEPSADLLPYIRLNCCGKAKVNQVAVGSLSGPATLFVNPQSQQTNSLSRDAVALFCDGSSIEQSRVELIRLDDYCQANAITTVDVLKVDVQGLEAQVLEGASGVLDQVRLVLLESTWLEPSSVACVSRLISEHRFSHVGVVSPVQFGADLAIGRDEFPEDAPLLRSFRVGDDWPDALAQ